MGEIVNLISVDCERLQQMWPYCLAMSSVPPFICISLFLIWQIIGASASAMFVVLLFVVPINGFCIANVIRKLQVKQMVSKDKRVRTMAEVLSGMKVLKLYSWEDAFKDKVSIFYSLTLAKPYTMMVPKIALQTKNKTIFQIMRIQVSNRSMFLR